MPRSRYRIIRIHFEILGNSLFFVEKNPRHSGFRPKVGLSQIPPPWKERRRILDRTTTTAAFYGGGGEEKEV